MLESRFSQDRRVLFREIGTPESVSKNSGVATGVSFSNGTMTFDGATSKLHYYLPISTNNGISYRFKFSESIDLPSSFGYIFSHLNSATESIYAFRSAAYFNIFVQSSAGNYLGKRFPYSGIADGKELCIVINEALTDIDCFIDGGIVGGKTDISAGAVADFTPGNFGVGVSVTDAPKLTGVLDLIEVCNYVLTVEEISLLAKNKLYTGFTQQNCVLHADFTKGTSLNWKNPAGIHTDTNVVYKHGIGAEFNGVTSSINYGNPNTLDIDMEDFSAEILVRSIDTYSFQPLLYKIDWAGVTAGYAFLLNSGNSRFVIQDGVNSVGGTIVLPIKANIGLFTLLGFKVDRIAGIIKVYQNGQYVNFWDISSVTGSLSSGLNCMVGKYGANKFTGFIKTIQFYKGKLLSDEDFQQNYQYARQKYGCL